MIEVKPEFNEEITVINNKEGYEIVLVCIPNGITNELNSRLILYAYKEYTVILNGNFEEPVLICVLPRYDLLQVINGSKLTEPIIGVIDVYGVPLSNYNELYHPSKLAINSSKKYIQKETNIFIYSGEQVKLNKETNEYKFIFSNGIAINIPFFILASFYNDTYCPSYKYNNIIFARIQSNTKNIICTNNSTQVYNIELSDKFIDLTECKIYKEIKDIEKAEPTSSNIKNIYIDSKNVKIEMMSNKNHIKHFAIISKSIDIFDLITKQEQINSYIHLWGINYDINCTLSVSHNDNYNTLLVTINIYGEILQFKLKMTDYFYTKIKQGLIVGLKD